MVTNVRQFREEAMLSREELAQKAGVSLSTIVLLEEGKTRPRITTQRKILEALNIPFPRRKEVFPDS